MPADAPTPDPHTAALLELHRDLGVLRRQLTRAEYGAADALAQVDSRYRSSAANLVHYVALRHGDRRALQRRLLRLGLSTLGRSESHVLQAVGAVAERVADTLAVHGHRQRITVAAAPNWDAAAERLHDHTRALLGPRPEGRHVAILVTLAWPEAGFSAWIQQLVAAGANCFRLNAAHDGPREWLAMAAAVGEVSQQVGRPLPLLVDLPGPKLRVAEVGSGPKPAHWKPERNDHGKVAQPLRVALVRPGQPPQGPTLVLPGAVLSQLQPGDTLELCDLRDKQRLLQVVAAGVAELRRGLWLQDGMAMTWARQGVQLGTCPVNGVIGRRPSIALRPGDRLLLRADAGPSDDGAKSATGQWVRPPEVGCSEPQAVRDLRVGERVLFDDGHMDTVVERTLPAGVLLQVLQTQGGCFKLRGDAGINVPDSRLNVPAIGPADREALAFAAQHADMVGLSFVRTAQDVLALHTAMDELGGTRLGVVLKIETRAAFAHLPAVLLAAMRRYPVGVMIARGDLAVELGFERLAEVQEEILWFCEAAHLPVIWATQVLDQLARTGQPSRAEVTDAAMAVRAECVMLNKGDHIALAVATLGRILARMEQHTYKKRQLYRQLQVATLRGAAAV